VPSTPAVLALRAHGVPFTPHPYRYEPHGGTAASARALGVDEHAVVKTLIMHADEGAPLIILMHGDREVSTRQLARALGAKHVSPCTPDEATRYSGYRVGGTSPFGTRKQMPIYMQRSILDLPAVYINGGARGFLVRVSPHDVVRVLSPTLVDVAV
jgi:Cys-tRNA(Pro) deacylase